jgi:putative ABC transport system permease protein
MALAIIMAVVGTFGLMSSITTSVLERRREIGVMRTIGASDGAVFVIILAECLLVALMSYVGAFLVSLPLSAVLGTELGKMAFATSLKLSLSPGALGMWGVLLAGGSLLAGVFPSRNAVRITVKETLLYE